MNFQPHDPTDECADIHCYSHHVDEPGDSAYIVCGECFHAYRTARELRRAYRRGYWQATSRPPTGLGGGLFGRNDEWGPSLWVRVWRVLTIRAKNISFCQECIHDF